MLDTNLFWGLPGTYEERRQTLANRDKAWLEAAIWSREDIADRDRAWLEATILDDEYNNFLSARADCGQPAGKRLPYIGQSWQPLPFHCGCLTLGNCGEFVGLMADNQHGFPGRATTSEEFAKIMAVIDAAMRLDQEGGLLAETMDASNAKLEELWPLLQTMRV
jgi:hypothetical protein